MTQFSVQTSQLSGFPGSPRLTKGDLVLVDPDSDAVQKIIVLQYSTNTLTRTLPIQASHALVLALWVWFKDKADSVDKAFVLTLVGIVSTICWYVFGAQDRHLVVVYRKHVDDAGAKIAEALGLHDYLGSAYVPVGNQQTKIKQKWYEYLYQWRCELLSTTKLAAWFPLLVTVYWIFMFVFLRRGRA